MHVRLGSPTVRRELHLHLQELAAGVPTRARDPVDRAVGPHERSVGIGGHRGIISRYKFTATYFVSRNSSRPSLPPSRPIPDCFTPPKGAPAFETIPWFRPTIPVSRPSQTRIARLMSRVKTYATR